jgi:hypothetical protein
MTTTIELNQQTANVVRANGDYKVTLSQPVFVDEGDEINLRMASIDSQKVESNTVVITEDMPIGIHYSYYDVDYNGAYKTSVDPADYNNPGAVWEGIAGNPSCDYFSAYADVKCLTWRNPSGALAGTGDLLIPGGYKADFTNPDKIPLSGSAILNARNAAHYGYPLPDGYGFKFTCQYIDENGERQTIDMTFNNAVLGTLQGASQSEPMFFQEADDIQLVKDPLDTGGVYTLNPEQDGFKFVYGSLTVISCEGYWFGPNRGGPNQPSGNQDLIPTLSGFPIPGSQPASNNYANGVQQAKINISQFQLNIVPVDPSDFSFEGLQLLQSTLALTIPAGTYSPEALAVLMTQKLNGLDGLQDQGAADDESRLYGKNTMLTITDQNNATRFRRIDQAANPAPTITFPVEDTYCYRFNASYPPFNAAYNDALVPTYFGASKAVINYGETGESYAVSYLHTPIKSDPKAAPFNGPDNAIQEALLLRGTLTGQDNGAVPPLYYLSWKLAKSAGGVFIHDMTPKSFWQNTLGLYESLVVPLSTDTNGLKYIAQSDIEGKVVENFMPRDGLLGSAGDLASYGGIDTYWRTKPRTLNNADLQIWIDSNNQTDAIIGSTLKADSLGYFLVEVQGLTRRNDGFVDDRDANPSIQAVVSSQFSSNDRITGFADSAITYTHKGAPYMIKELNVRILDPGTKQLLADLGEENSILIDINKAQIPPQIAPPPALSGGRKATK